MKVKNSLNHKVAVGAGHQLGAQLGLSAGQLGSPPHGLFSLAAWASSSGVAALQKEYFKRQRGKLHLDLLSPNPGSDSVISMTTYWASRDSKGQDKTSPLGDQKMAER